MDSGGSMSVKYEKSAMKSKQPAINVEESFKEQLTYTATVFPP